MTEQWKLKAGKIPNSYKDIILTQPNKNTVMKCNQRPENITHITRLLVSQEKY